jgi:hypothetical protein
MNLMARPRARMFHHTRWDSARRRSPRQAGAESGEQEAPFKGAEGAHASDLPNITIPASGALTEVPRA